MHKAHGGIAPIAEIVHRLPDGARGVIHADNHRLAGVLQPLGDKLRDAARAASQIHDAAIAPYVRHIHQAGVERLIERILGELGERKVLRCHFSLLLRR